MPKHALASPLTETGNREERGGITVEMSYSFGATVGAGIHLGKLLLGQFPRHLLAPEVHL